MKKIGIIGGTGYTGSELCRILSVHPEAEIASITSRNNAGKKVSDVHPFLKGYVDIDFSERVSTDVDLVFVATPHGVAMNEIPGLMDLGIKCIDLSGDSRMHDIPTYEKWYGHKHTDPEHLKDAVYGLPELFRKDIKGADLVANPGCYATASILACAPLQVAWWVLALGTMPAPDVPLLASMLIMGSATPAFISGAQARMDAVA